MKISFDLLKLGQIERRCNQRPKTAPQQKNPEDEREIHATQLHFAEVSGDGKLPHSPSKCQEPLLDSMPSGDARR